MGLSYLIAGFAFFFLPNFTIIDIMPDFIGCLLIIKGLQKVADLTPGLRDARDKFFKALYVYLAKFLLMFSVPFWGSNDGGIILILNFSFIVFEAIYAFSSFSTLLNGFLYLGERTDAKVLFIGHGNLNVMTMIFLGARSVFALLPDLSYVSAPEYSGVVSSDRGFYISDYKTILVALNLFTVTLLGVIWFVLASKYVSRIKKDISLMSYLDNRYKTEVLTNTGLFIKRDIRKTVMFLFIALLFTLDFQIDMINVIPDFVCGFFLVLASFILGKRCNCKFLKISSIYYTFISFFYWWISCEYADKYVDVFIWKNFEAYENFVRLNIFNGVKCVSFAVVLFALYKAINSIIDNHTGSSVEELESISKAILYKQNECKKENKNSLRFGLVIIILGIVRLALLYSLPVMSVFDTVLNAIWLIYLFKLFNKINEMVENRYM